MLSINTNTSSLFAQNSLTGAQNTLAASVQRLSSGLRINSGADDAAGLSISQNLQSQINGVNQSIQGLSNATSLLQVADSSLGSIQDVLLKMKQLTTQGLDGSLSSIQKLDIATQLDDLNSEINAIAQRTQFNGIGIISSGPIVDLVNSSIKAGVMLTHMPISIADNGLGRYAIGGSAGANANLGDAAITKSAINSTFQITLDQAQSVYAPGTYNLSSFGNHLTISGNYQGQYQTQTVVVGDAASDLGSTVSKTVSQTLNFNQFGISIALNTTVSQGATETGAQLATALVSKGLNQSGDASILQVYGSTAVISDVRLSGAAPGSYQLAKVGADQIELTNTNASGQIKSQTITLSDNAQNTVQTLNFQSLGVAIDVRSYQAQTASQIASELAAASGVTPTATLTSSGFSSPSATINLNPTNGYELTVGGNTYSTLGTLNGYYNAKVGVLGSSTTLNQLTQWVNNLKQNLNVDVSASITASAGSGSTLNISTSGTYTPIATGFMQEVSSSNASLVTATAGASALTGTNNIIIQTASSKTWSMTSADGNVYLDPVNGFQLNVGGVNFHTLGNSPGATSLASLKSWIDGLSLPSPITTTINSNTLTLEASTSNYFTVDGIESQIVSGFTSPNNLIAIAGSGLQLSVGSQSYSSANTFLNQTADGYSSLNDVVNWVNSLNAGV